MAYREITMIEIKEVLRRWVHGTPKKRLAAQLGLGPKNVRRYVQVAEQCGVRLEDGLAGLTDERVGAALRRAAMVDADEWLATFADPVRAQAAVDRFTSNTYDLVIDGESYRARPKPTLSRSSKTGSRRAA